MNNQTFKKGDNVFHAAYGWGKVMSIDEEEKLECPVEVEFYNWGCETFTDEGRTMPGYPMVLSFTEYTLEGFSLERPEEMPNKGDIVWVRDGKKFNWEVYHFLKHIPNATYPYMVAQDCNEDNFEAFKYLTTINPYKNEK
jgi:hypothetical protein